MKSLRILFCLPNLAGGGAERMVLTVAASLDRQRFRTRLFVHEQWGQHLGSLAPDQDIHFEHDRPYRRTDLVRSFLATFREVGNADVVVGAIEGRATFLALLAGLLRRRPIVVWVHADWLQFSRYVSWRQRLALRLYRFADRIVCCSVGAQEAFATMLPKARSSLVTIHNGIDVERVRRLSVEQIAPEHEAIFEKQTIVAVGRLDVQKGYDILIRAHARLRQHVDCNLVIIGDGPEGDALRLYAKEHTVADSVHFLGFQKNPFRYMRRASVYAMSSRFEGFALVLVEAMTCGAPVVSVACPSGPSEVLDDGKYGLLVETENPDAIALALKQVLTDAAMRERLSALSRERCAAFDISALTREWTALFDGLATTSRKPRRRPTHALEEPDLG